MLRSGPWQQLGKLAQSERTHNYALVVCQHGSCSAGISSQPSGQTCLIMLVVSVVIRRAGLLGAILRGSSREEWTLSLD